MGVLGISVGLGLYTSLTLPNRKGKHLEAMLPYQLAGRMGQDLSLGGTEALTAHVADTLNFDDMVYRGYSSVGFGELSVYAAY